MGLQVGYFHSETTELWPLIHVQNAFLLNILRMNRNFAYALVYIYIYMIYINPITFCFSLFFNRVMALDLCTKCVSPK